MSHSSWACWMLYFRQRSKVGYFPNQVKRKIRRQYDALEEQFLEGTDAWFVVPFIRDRHDLEDQVCGTGVDSSQALAQPTTVESCARVSRLGPPRAPLRVLGCDPPTLFGVLLPALWMRLRDVSGPREPNLSIIGFAELKFSYPISAGPTRRAR